MSSAGEILAQLSPEKRRMVALILKERRKRQEAGAFVRESAAIESGAEFVARTKAATAAQHPNVLPGDRFQADASGFWETLADPRTYAELAKLPGEMIDEARRHPIQANVDQRLGVVKGAVKGLAGLGALAVSAADVLQPGPAGTVAQIEAAGTRGASVLGPVAGAVDAVDRGAMAVIDRIPGRDPNAATNISMAVADELVGQNIDPAAILKGVRVLRAARAAGAADDVAKAAAREVVQESSAAASKAPATATEVPVVNAPAVSDAVPGATNTPAPATNVVPFRRSPEEPPAVPPDAARDWIAISNDLNQLDLKRRAALAAGEPVEPLPLEEIERLKALIKRRADRLYAEAKEAGQPLSRAQRDSLYSSGRVQLAPDQELALQAARDFRRKAAAYEEAGITLDDSQLQRLKAGDESNLLTPEQAKAWDDFNTTAPSAPKIRAEILGRVARNFPETVEKYGETGLEIGRRLRERDFRIASKTAADQQLIRDLKAQKLSATQWDEVVDLLEAKLPGERYGQVDPRVMDTAMKIQGVLAAVDQDAVAAGVLKELPSGEKVLFQGLKNYYPHLLRRDDPDKAALDVLYRRFGTRNRSLTHVRYADEEGYLRGSDTPDALGTYLRTARVHIEDTRAMGNDVQAEIERLGEQLKREGWDGSYAKIGLQHTFGTGARPTRFAREFVGGINRLQSALSMGLSAIAQSGQIVSPIAKAGFAPVAREAVTLAKAIWSPSARQHVDEIARMGATTGDMLEHMIGEPVNSRFSAVVSRAPWLMAFAKMDEALRLISAGVGPDYLRDLVGAIRGEASWWKRIGDFRTRDKIAAQAEEEIRRMGIDVERVKAGDITPDDDARAGFYLSRVTQFGVRPQDAPSLAFTPAGKFFYLFKRYALNQSAMIVNEIARPALQGGDLRPFARFLVAGSFVGAGAKTAQDVVLDRENYLLSKIKREVPQESLPRFIAWSLAASQLGIFYSLLTMRPSGFAEFLAGKNLSDVARILDTGRYYVGGAADATREGGLPGLGDWTAGEFDKARSGEGRINRAVERVAPIVRQVKEGVFHRDDE
jgi:hypothetical protein